MKHRFDIRNHSSCVCVGALVMVLLCWLAVVGSTAPTALPTSIRSSQNYITTITGSSSSSSTGTGGVATAASMNSPRAIWKDSSETFYVSEDAANCIRKFSYPNGIVSNSVGVCSSAGSFVGDNGKATAALLNRPLGLAVNTLGVIYVGDFSSHRVRAAASGIITTVLGTGTQTVSGDGGPATSASTATPHGLWIDSLGQVYVAGYQLIRKISTVAIVSSLAGTGVSGYSGDNGPATNALLSAPTRAFVDTGGVVYLSDGSVFRKVVSSIISTIVGTGSTTYNNENIKGTACNINGAYGIGVDSSNGDVYLSSSSNYRVVVLTARLA